VNAAYLSRLSQRLKISARGSDTDGKKLTHIVQAETFLLLEQLDDSLLTFDRG
jgi:hypothetical protein